MPVCIQVLATYRYTLAQLLKQIRVSLWFWPCTPLGAALDAGAGEAPFLSRATPANRAKNINELLPQISVPTCNSGFLALGGAYRSDTMFVLFQWDGREKVCSLFRRHPHKFRRHATIERPSLSLTRIPPLTNLNLAALTTQWRSPLWNMCWPHLCSQHSCARTIETAGKDLLCCNHYGKRHPKNKQLMILWTWNQFNLFKRCKIPIQKINTPF